MASGMMGFIIPLSSFPQHLPVQDKITCNLALQYLKLCTGWSFLGDNYTAGPRQKTKAFSQDHLIQISYPSTYFNHPLAHTIRVLSRVTKRQDLKTQIIIQTSIARTFQQRTYNCGYSGIYGNYYMLSIANAKFQNAPKSETLPLHWL